MPWLKGFFNFLKKEDDSGRIKAAVKLDELEKWLEDNSRENNEKIKYLISEITAEFDKSVRQARENLASLRKAEIRKVSDERLVALVEKQREIYANMAEEFINDISAKDKETGEFVKYYLEKRARFSRQSFRPFQITSELVGKPLERVMDDLREIALCMKKFSEALSNEMAEINALKMLCSELTAKSRSKRRNEEEIGRFLKNIEAINEEILFLKEEDENIGKSADYIEKEGLKQEIACLSSDIRLKKDSIAVSFSKINRALRKFEWIEKNKHKKELLAKLVEDVVETAMAKKAETGELLDEFTVKINQNEIDENIPDVKNAKDSLKTVDEIKKLCINLKDLQEKENNIRIKSNKGKIQDLKEETKKIIKLRQNCEDEIKEADISIAGIKTRITGKVLQVLGKEIEISG
jgi:hypothetical protein